MGINLLVFGQSNPVTRYDPILVRLWYDTAIRDVFHTTTVIGCLLLSLQVHVDRGLTILRERGEKIVFDTYETKHSIAGNWGGISHLTPWQKSDNLNVLW